MALLIQPQLEANPIGRNGRASSNYRALHVRTLLRKHAGAAGTAGGWHWSADPYEGCELACTFCNARLDRKALQSWRRFETDISVKVNAVEAFHQDVQREGLEGRPVVLGTLTEPWQQAEEHFRITRALLEAMAAMDGLNLRIQTRSSLIARDSDLLRKIAERGRVTVSISLSSLDEKITRLMEPNAPSPFRRLLAMEGLARAGVMVGLTVSPVLPGLDEDELGLEPLLTRAANAGAQFAGLEFLELGPGQRENFLSHVTSVYPQAATRFRRIIGVRPVSEGARTALVDQLDGLCARLGLVCTNRRALPEPPRRAPSQLALFG